MDVALIESRHEHGSACSTVIAPNGTVAVVPGTDLAPALLLAWYPEIPSDPPPLYAREKVTP